MKKKVNKYKNYRRCLSCRRFASKDNFVRVVRVYPTAEIKLNEGMGRSAYICLTEECLKIALHKKRLAKNLRANIPELIYQQLTDFLTKE